jgi:phage anti-repressor protein
VNTSFLSAVQEPDIDIVLNSCIMGNIPFILVEGMDDISKYHSIFSISDKYSESIQIEAIENIKDYSLGCEELIRCIDDLYINHPQKHDKINKYIISILDKDVRDIKCNLPTHSTYIILKEYSIESIYVCKNSIKILLEFLIKGPNNLINRSIINNIFISTQQKLVDDLYYSSLDALNFTLNQQHKRNRYKFEYGFIENNNAIFIQELSQDQTYKIHLDTLASSINLSKDLNSLMKFVKGKWLYRSFIKIILEEVNLLTQKCQSSQITTCCYCNLGKFSQCLYKSILTQGYDHIDNHLFKELLMWF